MSLFTEAGDDSVPVTRSSDDHAYVDYDSGVSYQGFDSFPANNFAADSDSVTDSPNFNDSAFASHQASEAPYSPPIYASDGGFLPEENGKAFDGEDGPILPDLEEMQREEGFALREWRRQNAIQIEEKEKREKELLSQIIDEADEYKVEFYRKRTISCESNKATNREKEKMFVASLEKFYAEADKDYWKSIAELVPNEVPTIAKRGKKDQEKKPSVMVVQGPKPGKPTDLSRMRQILVKLKHNTPAHLKHSPPPPPPAAAASPVEGAKPEPSKVAAVVAQPKEVLAAA